MHLTLTDVLTCPRCGGGLIVLAERMAGRQVMAGQLGCPACHTNYAIADGVADLGGDAAAAAEPAVNFATAPLRLFALTGLTDARGFLLLLGSAASCAQQFTGLIPALQVVAVNPELPARHEYVSSIRSAEKLPLNTGSVRAVISTGASALQRLEECRRVAAIGARIVLDTDQTVVDRIPAGLRLLAAEPPTSVLERIS